MKAKKKHAGGRPRKYDRDATAVLLRQYIDSNEIPIVAEFAHQNKLPMDLLWDWPEISGLLKECTAKKQAALERKALAGEVNVTMAIFSLKQMGWSDRQENTFKGDKNAPLTLVLKGSDVNG